ncbi:MAG: hypothetical protein KatS3mg019_1068 [Fimbriimonadales bacterium]|nr:MAG: hypothetical protein KatS3mg019_1068 [Fimbriimonadales bacterium]
MRTMAITTVASWLVSVLTVMAQPAVGEPQRVLSAPTAWLHRLDIDQLDPNKEANLAKIYLMLRCEDIPAARRLDYARRYLRGDYKYARPIERKPGEVRTDLYWCVVGVATVVLGKLNDTASIPLIEEKLKQWETEREKPLEERTMVAFDPLVARAVLARLKAVRAIPEVKTADDLLRRLEYMLRTIGFEGSRQEFLQALEREVEAPESIPEASWPGIYEEILMQYGQMVLEAGWQGVDVEPACRWVRLDLGERPRRSVKEVFEVYAQLAKVPRDKVAQWIVEDAMHWQRLVTREECYLQVLADQGVSVVPLVWSKLEWAARYRDQIKGNGMGLVALLEVLVTLGGEQALPLIEPFTRDENEWVRYYACRAKEYIQQGKAFRFGFGPRF